MPAFTDELNSRIRQIELSSRSSNKFDSMESWVAKFFGVENVAAKYISASGMIGNRLRELGNKDHPEISLIIASSSAPTSTVISKCREIVKDGTTDCALVVTTNEDGDWHPVRLIELRGEEYASRISDELPHDAAERVDIKRRGDFDIRAAFLRILGDYDKAKQQRLEFHPLADFIRTELPADVARLLTDKRLNHTLHVGGTQFPGNWANVPWLGIRDDRISTSFQSGLNLVYLFSEDGSKVFLCLGHGVDEARQDDTERFRNLVGQVDLSDNVAFGSIRRGQLGDSNKARSYESATLAHQVYERSNFPRKDELESDLVTMVTKLQEIAGVAAGAIGDQRPTYTLDDFCRETGTHIDVASRWLATTKRKQQIILQGPPGTGKTFVAERLARVLVSDSKGVIEILQFHPSYTYEDFLEGLRPKVHGSAVTYEPTPGVFTKFCETAADLPEGSDAVLIIDEFNRGNLSRIFGELMFALEYRERPIKLAVSGNEFAIPANVYIIGTMNTADRSIAIVDHALRRRFSFIFLPPQYDVLERYLAELELPSSLVQVLKEVNQTIGDKNYEIGASYFLKEGAKLPEAIEQIWTWEIEPYLEEYFFDDEEKVSDFRWEHLIQTKLADWKPFIESPHA